MRQSNKENLLHNHQNINPDNLNTKRALFNVSPGILVGITRVILPKENECDLDKIPDGVKSELTFVKVQTIEEVPKEALDIDLPSGMIYYEGNQCIPLHNV